MSSPVVIRGQARSNGSHLSDYLLKSADNDNVRVLEIKGTTQLNNLKRSLLEMSLTAELTKSDKGLFHAQINPAYGEDKMTREEWLKAADILEDELKLSGQKRVIVLHDKKGRTHAHVVWERYDHDKGIMKSDSFSRLAQDRARKVMEQVLEHKRTPDRNKRRPEMKKLLSELWQKSTSADHFIKEALANGYMVTKGRERSFMVVDDTGRSFDLVRQLEGVRTKEVREAFGDKKLLTDKMAIQIIRSREAMNNKQDAFIKGVENFKETQERKNKEKALYEKKLNQMKGAGAEVAHDPDDKNLSRSQNRAVKMQEAYKKETQEAIKKKFKEQFQTFPKDEKNHVFDKNRP